MKQIRFLANRWLLAVAGAGLLLAPGSGRAGTPPEPRLLVDAKPIQAEGNRTPSYAPVVKKAAPSVVTVFSTKTVKMNPQLSPFFNDPMLRRFFGFGDEEDSGRGRQRQYKEQGLGSGVIVTSDGYILSNNHVVEGADEIKVKLGDGKTEYTAKVVGTDPKTDIALLKVEAKDLTPITITDSDRLQVGDVVLAVGNPFGVGQTVTQGIVSGLGRSSLNIVDYEDFIQTDAAINPGNSGGALVDAEGRLVGIPSAIYSRSGGSMGVGFAIPANLACGVMKQLVKNGRVVRGYLGIAVQPVTPELSKAFKLPDQNGALVGEVLKDSPAAKAGLEDGDVIVEFDGKKVLDARQFRMSAAQVAPETKVPLKVVRDGKEKTLTATMGEWPGEKTVAGASRGAAKSTALDGVTVDDLDRRVREQFEIPAEVRGALVTKVDPDSASYDAGLRPGDVILEINRQRVRDARDAIEISDNIKDGRSLLRVWSKGGTRYIVVDESKKTK